MKILIKKITFTLFLMVGLNISTSIAKNNNDIIVGSVIAATGQKTTGFIEIAPMNDKGTRIPITIINGAKAGPTLSLIGGTHGYEYAPVMALQHVAQTIDPKDLNGNIIIVHVANMPSFLGRTIYYSPADNQNLNRMYPGKADGSLSQRIAYAITATVIKQADYLIDMHSGDGNEALRPYIYMPHTGKPAFDATIKAMAVSFGLDHIIIDNTEITEPSKSTFTDMTALTFGIPAMTTEVGAAGSTSPKWVDLNVNGVMNTLKHLKMISGKMLSTKPIVWLGKYEVVKSPETGIFKPSVSMGYVVAKGGKLGELVDFFGNHTSYIYAPFAGIVNYVIVTPPITKGEPLAMISEIKK